MFSTAAAKNKGAKHPVAVHPTGVHPSGSHPTALRPRAEHGTAVHLKANHGTVRAAKKRGKAGHSKVSSRTRGTPSQAVQASPSSDRYREIQEALAAKGYLKTPPNGVWDQESTEAMKRFQADQKLTSTGKLNSLSLIALGLGPKTTEMPGK